VASVLDWSLGGGGDVSCGRPGACQMRIPWSGFVRGASLRLSAPVVMSAWGGMASCANAAVELGKQHCPASSPGCPRHVTVPPGAPVKQQGRVSSCDRLTVVECAVPLVLAGSEGPAVSREEAVPAPDRHHAPQRAVRPLQYQQAGDQPGGSGHPGAGVRPSMSCLILGRGHFRGTSQGECRWATFRRYPVVVGYQPMTIAKLAACVAGEPGFDVVNLPAADLVPGTAA
jgi:hypothetical protein